MTKKEIVKYISDETGITQLDVKKIVQMTFDSIIETLSSDGRIELRKFGVFEVKLRKARRARNPRTNQPVDVEAKNVVTFQPGKDMEAKVKFTKPVSIPKDRVKKPKPQVVVDDEESVLDAPVIIPNPELKVPTASETKMV